MSPLRVLIVDDHAVVLEGLRSVLAADPCVTVVGEASDGAAAVDAAASLRPDIVVMDVSMPELNGVRATRRVLDVSPASRVLALTFHDEPVYVRELMRAGASGYLLKRTLIREVSRAIAVIARGGVYLDPALTASRSRPPGTAGTQAFADLTAREVDVASLSARGHTNGEIATSLGIAVKTVETHKTRLMAKLGLTSRAQLVRYAVHCGWLAE